MVYIYIYMKRMFSKVTSHKITSRYLGQEKECLGSGHQVGRY